MNTDRNTYKIAVAYFEKGLTQQEIASRYGLSRIKVSRILSRALKEKVVQINILPPKDQYAEIEQNLEEKYQLDEVVIVPDSNDLSTDYTEQAGKTAAEYFARSIQGNETVGLTWGRTLLSFVNHLPPMNFSGMKVVQMLGGLGEPQAEYHGADLTRRMAEKCGTRPYLIHAPGIVRSKEICDALREDIQVMGTLELAAKADLAIVGIGNFSASSHLAHNEGILSESDIQKLQQHEAVGDISLRFFTRSGEFINTDLSNRIVGIDSQQLANLQRIIGIAVGEEKYAAIKAVADQKMVNVLITDHHTAQKLFYEQ